ncbi:unnamed protein product [Brassicogethes aeneus]|uniref:Protein aurora borealis n=1 Tax=Brassicogethes aeneus TaxID=1431903 RepID=A0A9P0B4J4_BRAAE|nr:unnamed protein product [Brassicogethes aeneus]
MDFKMKSDKNKTPKSKIIGKVLNANSPFSSFPSFSTPPSRFVKIFNPFSQHLVERLHLPTLSGSPSVFNPIEKEQDKFKWSIDNISKFQPADIDETTIDQHVFDDDSHLESIVQDKIDKFFSEKVIIPSPMTNEVKSRALVCSHSPMRRPIKQSVTCSTQTTLTLPPKLPPHVEEALKPYFCYSEEKDNVNTSLHHQLFEIDTPSKNIADVSRVSSPALSTGLSPIHLPTPFTDERDNSLVMPPDCTLSPIGRKSPKHSKSACRLDFSEKMSVDASMLVPDIRNTSNLSIKEPNCSIIHDNTVNSSLNWDMEYKQLSLSPTTHNSTDKMDISNTTTPHSKQFPSQRKRLSESFKDEEYEEDLLQLKEDRKIKKQSVRDELAETGYMTGSIQLEDLTWDPHVFASTPSKTKSIVF